LAKKKVRTISLDLRNDWIERKPEAKRTVPSLKRQCELLRLSRSNIYYKARSRILEKEDGQHKRLIEEMYKKNPTYGTRRMTKYLNKLEIKIGRTRVTRLYRELGIQAIYPKPRTSIARKEHYKYPYLLKDLEINRADQVWATDITYIKLPGGFVYLTAVMDLYSRYVISWQLSTTLDSSFCVDALREALFCGTPEIFNSDQGVQYTSNDFTNELQNSGIRISMDGKDRCFDNIFVERLWRTIKYELIYLYSFENILELKSGLADYFHHYNNERLHQSLNYETPSSYYFSAKATKEAA